MSVFGYMRCDVSECRHNFAQRGVFPMSQMPPIRIHNKIKCQRTVPCKNLMFVSCWKCAVLEKRQSVKSSNLYERSNQEQCSLESQEGVLEPSIRRDIYPTLERSTRGCPLGVVVSTSMVGKSEVCRLRNMCWSRLSLRVTLD